MKEFITLKNSAFEIEIDKESGALRHIFNSDDNRRMDWVLPGAEWGYVENFKVTNVSVRQAEISVSAISQKVPLSLTVDRKLKNDYYSETYTFTNISQKPFKINQETFAICFPFNCAITKTDDFLQKTCNAHVWCGGNTTWIYGARLDGNFPYLLVQMTEGDCSDYSISRNVVGRKMVDYRGDILLNPTQATLDSGKSLTFTFDYRFIYDDPQTAIKNSGALCVFADCYSPQKGQIVTFEVACAHGLDGLFIECEGNFLPFEINGNHAKAICSFDTLGEKKITVFANGKYTFARLNVLDDIDTIYEKRMNFIADKQQLFEQGNPLDGAYLCYDDDTETTYYSAENPDYNAGRERICMGIAMLKYLQKNLDKKLLRSIKKHRAFVERELVDTESGTVYNEIGKDNTWLRLFNFPWFSIYYLEWFKLTCDRSCLQISANILLSYYENGGENQNSQMIEAVEILELLKENELIQTYEKLKTAFLRHCDKMLELDANCQNEECGYVVEFPTVNTAYTSQAYILTANEKYKKAAAIFEKRIAPFYSFQPDYHLNSISVRHWERYWFGKDDEYCDTMPQQWACIVAWAYRWFDRAFGTDDTELKKELIHNCLCLYRSDGFAANLYAPAFKTTVFSSVEGYTAPFMALGKFYDKNYDPRANDQDWILYFLKTCL